MKMQNTFLGSNKLPQIIWFPESALEIFLQQYKSEG